MPRRKTEAEEPTEGNDFATKVRDLDFDPWGSEEDDGSARRRDPLRRPAGERLEENDD